MDGSMSEKERRRYDRYDTDLKIEFQVNFDVKTKIDYRIKKKEEKQFSSQHYKAISNNISAEGISFNSQKKLNRGDIVKLELYVPSALVPIRMSGIVCWSHQVKGKGTDLDNYNTGIQVEDVNGESVGRTIFLDKEHQVAWSIVLESVFSSFKHIALKRKKLE